jgi:hypothetical protein
MNALQEERNKLVLQLADMKSTGGGGGNGGRKRSGSAANDDIEKRKEMMEHASNVRLQEMIAKTVSRELSLMFLCPLFWLCLVQKLT